MRYFVPSELLRTLAFPAVTTLKRIEDHCLRALVLEDRQRYLGSVTGEIHLRIGEVILHCRLRSMLGSQIEEKVVRMDGKLNGARYFLEGKVFGRTGR